MVGRSEAVGECVFVQARESADVVADAARYPAARAVGAEQNRRSAANISQTGTNLTSRASSSLVRVDHA